MFEGVTEREDRGEWEKEGKEKEKEKAKKRDDKKGRRKKKKCGFFLLFKHECASVSQL